MYSAAGPLEESRGVRQLLSRCIGSGEHDQHVTENSEEAEVAHCCQWRPDRVARDHAVAASPT